MVRRAEVFAIEDLLDLAVEAEQTVEYAKTYGLPPLPESTLLPETAYKPSPEGRQPKPKISAVTADEPKASDHVINRTRVRVLCVLVPGRHNHRHQNLRGT